MCFTEARKTNKSGPLWAAVKGSIKNVLARVGLTGDGSGGGGGCRDPPVSPPKVHLTTQWMSSRHTCSFSPQALSPFASMRQQEPSVGQCGSHWRAGNDYLSRGGTSWQVNIQPLQSMAGRFQGTQDSSSGAPAGPSPGGTTTDTSMVLHSSPYHHLYSFICANKPSVPDLVTSFAFEDSQTCRNWRWGRVGEESYGKEGMLEEGLARQESWKTGDRWGMERPKPGPQRGRGMEACVHPESGISQSRWSPRFLEGRGSQQHKRGSSIRGLSAEWYTCIYHWFILLYAWN